MISIFHLARRPESPPAVTAALLDAKHGELYARLKNHSHLLSAAHWRSTIEADRAAALAGDGRDRKRCWGTKK